MFLNKIKEDLNDERNRRGRHDQCSVNADALRQLLHHYELIEAERRAEKNPTPDLNEKLHDILHALYLKNHDSERLMMLIMDILRPLIKERMKSRYIDNICKT